MEDLGLGPHGNSVSIRMGTAQAPVCVGHVHVTALVLAAEVAAVKGPGSRSQIAQEMALGHPGLPGPRVAPPVGLAFRSASDPAATPLHGMGAESALDRAGKKDSVMRTVHVHYQFFGLHGVLGINVV